MKRKPLAQRLFLSCTQLVKTWFCIDHLAFYCLFFSFSFLPYIWVFACISVYAPCTYLVPVEARRGLHPLDLELQIIVSHHVVLRTEPMSSVRATGALNHWASSPAHLFCSLLRTTQAIRNVRPVCPNTKLHPSSSHKALTEHLPGVGLCAGPWEAAP